MEGSPPCAADLMGWPPQPVVWHIYKSTVRYVELGWITRMQKQRHTILYIGTDPYESATVPRIMLKM